MAEPEALKCQRPSLLTLADLSIAHLQSMVYKKIYRSLCASPAYESLIADAISASSTGKHNAVLTHTGSLASAMAQHVMHVQHETIRLAHSAVQENATRLSAAVNTAKTKS